MDEIRLRRIIGKLEDAQTTRPNGNGQDEKPLDSIVSPPLSLLISEIKVDSEAKPGTAIAKLQEEDGSHVLYKGTKAFHNMSKKSSLFDFSEKASPPISALLWASLNPHCQNRPVPPSVAVALDSGFDAPPVIANR